jgi:hypothetical protein
MGNDVPSLNCWLLPQVMQLKLRVEKPNSINEFQGAVFGFSFGVRASVQQSVSSLEMIAQMNILDES